MTTRRPLALVFLFIVAVTAYLEDDVLLRALNAAIYETMVTSCANKFVNLCIRRTPPANIAFQRFIESITVPLTQNILTRYALIECTNWIFSSSPMLLDVGLLIILRSTK